MPDGSAGRFSVGRATASQLGRYAFAGLALTLGNAGSYWALTQMSGIDPMISLALTSLAFLVAGYVTHARFTFKSHANGRHWSIRGALFILVRLVGLAINQFFVWVLVKRLGGPTWWPIIPMVFVTPLIIFVLLRGVFYRPVEEGKSARPT